MRLLPNFPLPLRHLPALAVFLALLLPSLAHAATLNVPAQYATIQAAVNAAASGDTVLVAAGTYSGAGNRDIDFGGKNLTVTSSAGAASTIIDCGGYKSTDGSGNHRGFYIHSGETAATISGFTVKNGYETDIQGVNDSSNGNGGGICIVNTTTGTITLTNCTVSGNTATFDGGGVYGDGGGVYSENNHGTGTDTITLTNCTVSGNNTQNGGGVYNENENNYNTITLTNDIIYGDTGGEVANVNGSPSNATASSCDILGGYPGTNNIDADPLFVNAAHGDFHLQAGSPCLGAGTSTGSPATDKDGNPRANPPCIGAYEGVNSSNSQTHILWTNPKGAFSLWTVYNDGSHTSTPGYGPIPGWNAKAIADGTDGQTRVLLQRAPDGAAAVWTVNSDGSHTSTPGYGPSGDWTVQALAVGSDNLTRLLWKNTRGSSSVWTVYGDGSHTSTPGYGPYGDWTATAISAGP